MELLKIKLLQDGIAYKLDIAEEKIKDFEEIAI